jgi:hypothetical protein
MGRNTEKKGMGYKKEFKEQSKKEKREHMKG